jgi:hypothetical protein
MLLWRFAGKVDSECPAPTPRSSGFGLARSCTAVLFRRQGTGLPSPCFGTSSLNCCSLADVAKLLGELQEPDFGTDDLLFGRHGALQSVEAGRFATPTAPRPASALVVPWARTPHVRLSLS